MSTWALFLDESLASNLITVGGFMAEATRLPALALLWRDLKEATFGLGRDAELKYTFSSSHATRVSLDGAGWPQSQRVPAMLERIRDMDLVIVADTMIDLRVGTHPRDFYLDALKWCIRRFANHVGRGDGGHWVVVDMPSPPKGTARRDLSPRLRDLHKDIGMAPFDVYQQQYWHPEDFGSGKGKGDPLRTFGFAPTLTAAHARYSDLLQVADVIVGSIRDFCDFNLNGAEMWSLPPSDYREENFKRIAGCIRAHNGKVKGSGFDVFPYHLAKPALLRRVEELARAARP